jgi:hypothetical protein
MAVNYSSEAGSDRVDNGRRSKSKKWMAVSIYKKDTVRGGPVPRERHREDPKCPESLCFSQKLRFQSRKFVPCRGAQTLTIHQSIVLLVPITCFCRRVDHNSHAFHQDVNMGEWMSESRDLSSKFSDSRDLVGKLLMPNCRAYSQARLCLFRLSKGVPSFQGGKHLMRRC